jgi:hypothetical protein
MTNGFKEYLQNTKDEFVTAVYELNLSPAQRVPMENMILAFDQCRHKLEAQLQQPVVSGELPISCVNDFEKPEYCSQRSNHLCKKCKDW